ncbi:MAG: hypothetical protein ACI9OJ_004345 [Myxococcota bacterium]|jgi:hypothetical protein
MVFVSNRLAACCVLLCFFFLPPTASAASWAALDHPRGGGAVRMVYLLTDGGVGNDYEVLVAVRQPAGDNRIFPVGIGSAPNRILIDRLADEGRGFPTYLNLVEDSTPIVNTLLERSSWPYLTDIMIDWGGLPVTDMTPARLPDVYAGLPLVVAGRDDHEARGQITIGGTRAGQPFELPLELDLPAAEDRAPGAYAWAGRRIRELFATQYGGEIAEVVAEVTRLGLSFTLVTPYTSFIGIGQDRVVENGGTGTGTITQPNETPMGYGGSPVYGGQGSGSGRDDAYGESDPVTLVLALMLLALGLARRRKHLA